jgi:ABC-type branched-subunit amino acid transport system substrate-binding protein
MAMPVKFEHLRRCPSKVIALFCALNQITAFRNRKALAAVIAIALMHFMSACADGNTLKIAGLGPLSGKDSAGGQAMLDGVNLYVAEINERGVVPDTNLQGKCAAMYTNEILK